MLFKVTSSQSVPQGNNSLIKMKFSLLLFFVFILLKGPEHTDATDELFFVGLFDEGLKTFQEA